MITLEPVFDTFAIPYPAVVSEFEVHAHLLVGLKKLGLDARANVVAPAKFTNTRKNVCTFDIVIFSGRKPEEIIEVKNGKVRHKNGVEATRQGHRYRFFGVPVTFVYGMEEANQLIEQRFCQLRVAA